MASVWDGTRSKFLQATDPKLRLAASKVWVVRFEDNLARLPDDLLVTTRHAHAVAREIRHKLQTQDGSRTYPTGSDVQGWVLWDDNAAEDARTALAELRRQASASNLPVVVDVRPMVDSAADPASSKGKPPSDDELEAVGWPCACRGPSWSRRGPPPTTP